MNITEARSIQAALEAALLNSSGGVSFTIGDREVKYDSQQDIINALAQINRSIQAYDRALAGRNPQISRAKWFRR